MCDASHFRTFAAADAGHPGAEQNLALLVDENPELALVPAAIAAEPSSSAPQLAPEHRGGQGDGDGSYGSPTARADESTGVPGTDASLTASTCDRDGCETTRSDNDEQRLGAAAAAQAALTRPTDSGAEDESEDDLVRWIRENGGVIRRVTSGATRWGNGMVAASPIRAGDPLLSLPSKLLLTTHTVLQYSNLSGVLRLDEHVRQHTGQPDSGDIWALTLALEYERHNPWSPWAPYTSSLPHPSSPVWWSALQLNELHSSAAAAAIAVVQRDVRTAFDAMVPHLIRTYPELFSADTNTLESFTWSALTVWGRAFDLDHAGRSEVGLIPFMDLANHRAGVKKTKAYDGAHLTFAASDPVAAGDEVLISYGDAKPTLTYLTRYGFIPPTTQGDFVALIGVSATQPDRSTAAAAAYTPPATGMDPLGHIHRRSLVARVGVDGRVTPSFLSACAVELSGRDPLRGGTDEPSPADLCGAVQRVRRGVRAAVGQSPTGSPL